MAMHKTQQYNHTHTHGVMATHTCLHAQLHTHSSRNPPGVLTQKESMAPQGT